MIDTDQYSLGIKQPGQISTLDATFGKEVRAAL